MCVPAAKAGTHLKIWLMYHKFKHVFSVTKIPRGIVLIFFSLTKLTNVSIMIKD